MPTPEDKRGVELLETVRKKRTALERRLAKVPYRVIADELKVSVGTVRLWVKEMTVTMLPQDEIEELRAQEAAGIDESENRANIAIQMLMRQAARKEENNESVNYELEQIGKWQEHIVSLRKQRAMLLGLNAPVQVQHKHTVRTEFDAEVESLVTDLLGGGKVLSNPDQVDVGD